MKIHFLPDSDVQDFSEAIAEYGCIWTENGEEIIRIWEEVTGLTFRETEINAVVFDARSHSHPLALRYNLDPDRKKSVLIHELGHRLIHGRVNHSDFSSLENHKTLFLVLYKVFEEIFGKDFAEESVEWDKNLPSPVYKEAWEWALSFSEEEKKEMFEKRIKR